MKPAFMNCESTGMNCVVVASQGSNIRVIMCDEYLWDVFIQLNACFLCWESRKGHIRNWKFYCSCSEVPNVQNWNLLCHFWVNVILAFYCSHYIHLRVILEYSKFVFRYLCMRVVIFRETLTFEVVCRYTFILHVVDKVFGKYFEGKAMRSLVDTNYSLVACKSQKRLVVFWESFWILLHHTGSHCRHTHPFLLLLQP